MEKIAFYGKGGIGKSTVSSNVSALLAGRGQRMLHVGCDPKHDSSMPFIQAKDMRTVLDTIFKVPGREMKKEYLVMPGRLGIDCIESGGPEPGVGCGGRGVSRMFELLDELGVLDDGQYDTAIFDVLGDVVCGGFAAPLRRGFARKIVIVASEEIMALYAANNISKAIGHYQDNGVALTGLVFNLRDNDSKREQLEDFAAALGTRVLAFLPRERAVREAQLEEQTVVEYAPDSEISGLLAGLTDELLGLDPDRCPAPTPLGDEAFRSFVKSLA